MHQNKISFTALSLGETHYGRWQIDPYDDRTLVRKIREVVDSRHYYFTTILRVG